MSKLLTAKDAKELAKLNKVDEYIDTALIMVKSAAEKGKEEVIVRNGIFGEPRKNNRPAYKKVIDKLEKLGYNVSEYYDARQFVDIGTIINWGD